MLEAEVRSFLDRAASSLDRFEIVSLGVEAESS